MRAPAGSGGRGRAASFLCQRRVPPRLESPALDRLVRISAKPSKLLREALQPVLAKHGLSPQQVELRRVSRGRGRPGRADLGGALLRAGSRLVGGPSSGGQDPGVGIDLSVQPGEKEPLDLENLVSTVATQRLLLNTLPGR